MDEFSNPYRPGAGARPPAVIGRDDLIDRFGVTVRRALAGRPGKSIMPTGLRGVGKTVLLNRFVEVGAGLGMSACFIEAPEGSDFRALMASHLRKSLLELRGKKATGAVLRALRVLKAFSLQIPDGPTVSIDVDPLIGQADSGIIADDVTDLLVAVGHATRSVDSGFLLAIDELQYLSEAGLAALISAVHRTVQIDLPVVLVGAGLPQLPGLAGTAKSYAERLFEFPQIGSLGLDESAAALRIPAQKAGVDFTEDALSKMIAEAQGYPYFLQEWGYGVWNEAEGPEISLADVERANPLVVRKLDENFFRVRFDRLTPKEKEYLRAMAELGPGPHRSGDIAARLAVAVESVAPRRSMLITKGMVFSPAHGDTAFTVPLFDRFLRRVMPGWRPQTRPGRGL